MGKRMNVGKGVLRWAAVAGGLALLCAPLAPRAAAVEKKRISIGGASAGGAFYPLSVGMAGIINKYLPAYNAVALETGGTLENIRLVTKGEVEIANANARDATLGYKGEKPFNSPLKNLRTGFYLGTFALHIVALESSNIQTVEDLKGKVVNVGPPGSIVQSTMEAILKLHGLSLKDIKLRHLGYSEAMEGVGDGVIDAGALYSAIPAPAVASLAATKKIRLVTANEKLLEAVAGKENVVPLYIAAQTYKGQSEGAFVWSVVSGTYFSDEVSADDVYNWTKAILEHKDELQKVHPMGKNARLLTKKELETIPVPLHPGILRYAKEIGVSY